MVAMQRREFLAGALLAAQTARGANDRVVVGLIGSGGRGRYVASKMREAPGVEFGAVCDIYQPNVDKAREWAGEKARGYGDFRKLLEQKDLDAVLIATPDHWHAITTILALQAGKDVYVEKPLAHNIRECQAMRTAALKSNRVVQTGTQHRSAPHYREVQRMVQGGEIGEVKFVRVWNYLNMYPDGIGSAPDSEPPPGMDWDMFCGPAPKVPYNPKRHQATYRWFRDYAGGFITDYGTHRFDTVHQIMGQDSPTSVVASGGRLLTKGAGDQPDLMQVTYDYPGFILSYECNLLNGHGLGGRTPKIRYYNMHGVEDRPHGEAYYGTKGTIFADRIGFEVYPEEAPMHKIAGAENVQRKSMNTTDATGLHTANFVECVRSRNKPLGEIEVGYRATTVALLGNVALAAGRKLNWDGAKGDFVNDREASKMLGRHARKPWDMITL